MSRGLDNPFNPDYEDLGIPELTLFGDVEWNSFPKGSLPPVVEEYCNQVAEYMRVDDALVKGIALSVMASACQHYELIIKEGIAQSWSTNENLYVMIRAERGERKTPCTNILAKPIYQWEREYNKKLSKKIKTERAKFGVLKTEQKRIEREARQNDEADKKLQEINEEIENFKFTKQIQMVCDDATTEALGCVLNDNQGVGAILSTEGGVLSIWNGSKYGSGVTNADIPLKAYSGESFRVNRTGRDSVLVDKPILTILLCIQGVVLKEFISDKNLVGRGLIDRFIFITPRESIGNSRFNTIEISSVAECNYSNTITRILDTRFDADGKLNRPVLRLSSEARNLYAEWHDRFQQRIADDFPDLKGWASKHVETVARLSGIFQIFDEDGEYVNIENMQRAIILSDYLQEQVKVALCGYVTDDDTKEAEVLMKRMLKVAERKIEEHEGELYLSFSEIQQNCKTTACKKKHEFIPLLKVLSEMGQIATPLEKVRDEYRCCSIESAKLFYINPKLIQ